MELNPVAHSVLHWEVFDRQLGAPKGAYLVLREDERVLLDPFVPTLTEEARRRFWRSVVQAGEIHGILLSSMAHLRDAPEFCERLECDLWVPEGCPIKGQVATALRTFGYGGGLPAGLEAIPLPGANPGECAFHRSLPEGQLFVGDAVLNLPGEGLSLLPARYGGDPPTIAESLSPLFERSIRQLFPGHGPPLLDHAEDRLRTLRSL